MITVPAHAKVNLTLDVLGTLPGGYHEIRSVMQALELHDTLEICAGEGESGIEISGDSGVIPLGPENLVYKAAALLMREAALEKPVRIAIQKRIPVAAGLGGGSADAAATLVGLNKLWDLRFTREKLMDLGSRLGADVPFFLYGETALAGGKGEKLSALPSPPPLGVVLVKPHFSVSTARIYRLFDELSPEPEYCTDKMVAAMAQKDVTAIASSLGNALEPVTAGLHPEVEEIKHELKKAGAMGVKMSGSGPTVFALTPNIEQAHKLAAGLKTKQWTVIVTRFKV